MHPEQFEEYGPDEGPGDEWHDPDAVDDDQAEAEEWTEGQCDNCTGSTPAEVAAAAKSRVMIPVCACAIGQGAPADACVCGRGGEVS